ncbi:hypothetical protein ACFL0Q_04825 [Thermodesulfobacteriota bacterium]
MPCEKGKTEKRPILGVDPTEDLILPHCLTAKAEIPFWIMGHPKGVSVGKSLVFLVVLVLVSAGCASETRQINPPRAIVIEEGVTTRAEIENALKLPQFFAVFPDNETKILEYHWYNSTAEQGIRKSGKELPAGSLDAPALILRVFLDSADVVQKYEFTYEPSGSDPKPFP